MFERLKKFFGRGSPTTPTLSKYSNSELDSEKRRISALGKPYNAPRKNPVSRPMIVSTGRLSNDLPAARNAASSYDSNGDTISNDLLTYAILSEALNGGVSAPLCASDNQDSGAPVCDSNYSTIYESGSSSSSDSYSSSSSDSSSSYDSGSSCDSGSSGGGCD